MLHVPQAQIIGDFPHPSQEDIQNCPNFLPSSAEYVLGHPDTPEFVKQVIESIPWTNTRKYQGVLIRTAHVDENAGMTGCFWHIDIAGETADHSVTYDDLKLWLITFGEVNGEGLGGTEFITSELELPEIDFSNPDYSGFSRLVESKTFESFIVPSGRMVQYSTYDVHRGLFCREGHEGYRMTIICAESDHIRHVDSEKNKLSARVDRY